MLEKKFSAESHNRDIGSHSSVMTLEDIYWIIRRRQKGIILAFILSFAGALSYHYLQVPEYRAV